MHSYSNGQSNSKLGSGQANNESGNPFRKVVDGNGSSCMTLYEVDMNIILVLACRSVTQVYE